MPNTFELIASYTAPSAQANISFTSIPATFTDLVLKISGRTTRSETQSDLLISFNGSTANFTNKYINGVPVASVVTSGSFGRYIGLTSAGNATASTFGNTEVYIPNYAGSSYKSFSSEGVSETNSNEAQTLLSAGLWSDTAAINSITIASATGGDNFATNSTAYLYGVKNA